MDEHSVKNEEIDRYQKILEDWKPGPGSGKSTPTPARQPQPSRPQPANRATASSETGYEAGAILRLDPQTVVVYRRYVPEKDYHLVLVPGPEGNMKTHGVALEAYEPEELGSLPRNWLNHLAEGGALDRDLLVFHAYSYDDVRKLPRALGRANVQEPPQNAAPDPAGNGQPGQAPPPPKAEGLRRGQRLQVRFGNNAWDAVYWGRDDQGDVVAHKTYDHWSLMHLDLKRFEGDMKLDPDVDQALVDEIEASLAG